MCTVLLPPGVNRIAVNNNNNNNNNNRKSFPLLITKGKRLLRRPSYRWKGIIVMVSNT
jgi:hypothetical protein